MSKPHSSASDPTPVAPLIRQTERGEDVAVARPALPLFGDMRSHRRMQLALAGIVTADTGVVTPCVTRDISDGGAALESAHELSIGETVSLHLDKFGDLEAEVARVFPGGFAVVFRLAPERRIEIAEMLGALWRRSPLSLIEVSLEAVGPDGGAYDGEL